MINKTSLSVEHIRFFTLEYEEDEKVSFILEQLPYDDRSDFIADETFRGLAVNILLCNMRDDEKGVRREILVNLIDATLRCEIGAHKEIIYMRRNVFSRHLYLYFPADSTGLQRGHEYKLIVSDLTSRKRLAEKMIHLFDRHDFQHPTRWYEVCHGGIRPAWESNLYKSLKTVDVHDYYVRFNVIHKFGAFPPAILPELEIRLFYPDGKYSKILFKEPRYKNIDGYDGNQLFVEALFNTIEEVNGVFYAELLCMEYPIAGFVFHTKADKDFRGAWIDHELEPLDEYFPATATQRLKQLLPYLKLTKEESNA